MFYPKSIYLINITVPSKERENGEKKSGCPDAAHYSCKRKEISRSGAQMYSRAGKEISRSCAQMLQLFLGKTRDK